MSLPTLQPRFDSGGYISLKLQEELISITAFLVHMNISTYTLDPGTGVRQMKSSFHVVSKWNFSEV